MKIILSRKGFDSSAGGVPSPILPDGRLVSLPIPDCRSPVRYGDIGRNIGTLVSNLTAGRIRHNSRAHLDPDLVAGDLPRSPGWRPLFGQAGAAQGHLRRQGVGPGDLFLFFGLFQAVERRRGKWRFIPGAPRLHVIWGWLQVGGIHPVDRAPAPLRDWAADHPHFGWPPDPSNTLYVTARQLRWPNGRTAQRPAAGIFEHFRPTLCLTDREGSRPGLWRLPDWCHPVGDRVPLTYHARPGRWQWEDSDVRLQSVSRGQEFVLSARDYPDALNWVSSMIDQDS